MVVLSSGPKLTADDLPLEIVERTGGREDGRQDGRERADERQDERRETTDVRHEAGDASRTLADNEKNQILSALARCGGNKSKAADELGISRRTIHRKLNAWGIQ